MKSNPVAKRYAQALFENSLEDKELEMVSAELDLLEKDYQDIAEIRELIHSPVIPDNVKQDAFAGIYQERLSDTIFTFIKLLIRKKRETLLVNIIQHFRVLQDQHQGIVRGVVYSVVPLTDEQQKKLQQHFSKLLNKEVLFIQQRDEKLLGGVVVKINDRVYDASIRNRLNRLRETLISS